MSHQRSAKTKKSKTKRKVSLEPKTRLHSNLRPSQRHSKSFLKTYYPYIPLLVILLMIVSLLQPWKMAAKNNGVLAYATNMSSKGLLESSNSARQHEQQKPLKLNKQLSKAAQNKANDMVKVNYWSHDRPNGDTPWTFINAAGYSYTKAGENLAYGFSDEKSVIAGWLNSPSHRDNVLDKNFEDVGFGFANSGNFDKNGPSTVIVAMYGTNDKIKPVANSTNSNNSTAPNTTTLGKHSEPPSVPSLSVSRIQAFTGGSLSWSPYFVGFLIGALAVYLTLHHGLNIKKNIQKGEKFFLKHPLLDITIVSAIVLGVLVLQRVGVVL